MHKSKLCPVCNQLTNNPKYCSTSCAAKVNNKLFPKKHKPKTNYYCIVCSKLMGCGYKFRKKYCKDCKHNNPNFKDWSSITIEQHFSTLPNFQANSRIRGLARQAYRRANKPKSCQNCGYSKFIEVCHIKPVSSFPRETYITAVNEPNNLIGLCPNCHWELDNGLLAL